MKRKAEALLLTLGLMCPALVNATGPYTATVERLQATDIGNPYNTVFLNLDITDSPCSSTNTHNRFTVTNETQLSAVLAALMANKTISIYGTGSCNFANVENVSAIVVKP